MISVVICLLVVRGTEENPVKTDDRQAMVQQAATAIEGAINDRYLEVASASKAYGDALNAVVKIRARVEREADGTLASAWVKSLAQAYQAVAASCDRCSDNAERIDPANWSQRYSEQISRVKDKQAKDELSRERALAELKGLEMIPDTRKGISERSRIGTCHDIVEQTETRLKIYTEALSLFDRIDALVNSNDRIVSDFGTIYRNMAQSYREFADTLFAVYELRALRDVENALLRIASQPSLLLDDVQRVSHEWEGIRAEISKIIGS